MTSTSSTATNQQKRRRGQVVEVTAPGLTNGTLEWGPSSHRVDVEGGRTTAWIAWDDDALVEQLDVALGRVEAPSEDEWHRQSFIYRDDTRLVFDDTWAPPPMAERPAGEVDWDALEANYVKPWMRCFDTRRVSLYFIPLTRRWRRVQDKEENNGVELMCV
ncbi:hypothetical protein Ct61P_02948 [Colletotrichum tofieldiae]|nr:hypothetical protein Ct61P_02948 [Colletotrichum tofieldiae]